MLLDEGSCPFRIPSACHTVVAARYDDQFGFDADFFQLFVKVLRVLDRDDHVLVTMNLHDRWIVVADE